MDFGEPGVAGLFAGFEGGGAPAFEFARGAVGIEADFAVGGEKGLEGGRAEFSGLADDFNKHIALGQADGEHAGRGGGQAGDFGEAHAGGAGVVRCQSSRGHPTLPIEQLHQLADTGAADADEVAGFVGGQDDFAARGGPGAGMEHAEHEGVYTKVVAGGKWRVPAPL